MKRDMDLARKILFAIEKSDEADRQGFMDYLKIEGDYSENMKSYHVVLLEDAGLIEAEDFSTIGSYDCRPKGLTWEGHEFLDGIRKEETWEKIKNEAANLSFTAIKAWILSNIQDLTP